MAIDLLTYTFLKKYVEGSAIPNTQPKGVYNPEITYETGSFVTYDNKVYIVPYGSIGEDGKGVIQTVKGVTPGAEGTEAQWQLLISIGEGYATKEDLKKLAGVDLTKIEGDIDSVREAAIAIGNIYTKDEVDNKFVKKMGNADFSNGNFSHGTNNLLGTRGFDILGYSGEEGGEGKYKVTGTAGIADAIKSAIETKKGQNKSLFYSLSFGSHWDYRDVIESATYDANEDCIWLEVSKLFTNNKALDKDLGEKDDYIDDGTLIICGYPELGTKIVYREASAFGHDNTVQGEGGIAVGKNQLVVGNYGAAFGRDNISGYATLTAGHGNKMGNTHYSNGLGQGNETRPNNPEGIVKNVNLIGTGLISGYSWQTILGNYNENKSNTLLEVGIGTKDNLRKNGLEVYRDGTVKVLEGDELVELANKKYVDEQIGDIDTALNTILEIQKRLLGGATE